MSPPLGQVYAVCPVSATPEGLGQEKKREIGRTEKEAEPVFGRDAEDKEAGAGSGEVGTLEMGGGSCSAPICAGETTLRWPGEASSCAGARIFLVAAPLAPREE